MSKAKTAALADTSHAGIGHNSGAVEPRPKTKTKKATSATVVQKRATRKSDPKKHFVNNKDLLLEIRESKKNGFVMTDKLAKMLSLMVEKYGTKPGFSGYSYRDEMEADALLNLVAKWYKFDEEKGTNPFAFYTTLIHRSFLRTLEKEKRVQRIKDRKIEDAGRTPSFARQIEDEMEQRRQIDEEEED